MFSLKGHYVIHFRRFSIKDFGNFESWLLKEEVLQTSVLKAKKDNLESFTEMKLLYFKSSLSLSFNCSRVLSILVISGRGGAINWREGRSMNKE